MVKTRVRDLRFGLGNHQARTSEASTAPPICVNGPFRPARVRLIRGKAELLPGMYIVKNLGAQVFFGSDRFKVGQGEWMMMAFNKKHHYVFPLAPTACAYTNLGGYFAQAVGARGNT